MAIDVSSEQYNAGFLPDIKLLTLCYPDIKSCRPYSLFYVGEINNEVRNLTF